MVRMASWQDFVDSAPEFGERAEALFTARKHHTMATLRRDGSPRISGTEVDFDDGQLCLGMMAGTGPRGGPPPRSSCRDPQPRRRSSGGKPRRMERRGKALRTCGGARRRCRADVRSVPNRHSRCRADSREHAREPPRHRAVEPRLRTRSPRTPLTPGVGAPASGFAGGFGLTRPGRRPGFSCQAALAPAPGVASVWRAESGRWPASQRSSAWTCCPQSWWRRMTGGPAGSAVQRSPHCIRATSAGKSSCPLSVRRYSMRVRLPGCW